MESREMSELRLAAARWRFCALLLLAIFVFQIGSCIVTDSRRAAHFYAAENLLDLAITRDFDGMSKFAAPGVVEFMRERDARYGKVVAYRPEGGSTQVLGGNSEMRFQVWRERGNVRETYGGMGHRVFHAAVTWHEAEAPPQK